MVLEQWRRRWGLGNGKAVFSGLLYEARLPIGSDDLTRIVLFEPQLYMNRSGEAVKGLVQYYKLDLQNLLIVLDDMALPLGHLRARVGGSAGGHNGLEDILRLLGTQEVPRLRIGIEAPPEGVDPADYVLSAFGGEQQEGIEAAIHRAAEAVSDWIAHDIRFVMDRYNRKNNGLETDTPPGATET